MGDSGDWYDQERKKLIAAYGAGKIDYQQYIDMNRIALKKYFGKKEKLVCYMKDINFER